MTLREICPPVSDDGAECDLALSQESFSLQLAQAGQVRRRDDGTANDSSQPGTPLETPERGNPQPEIIDKSSERGTLASLIDALPESPSGRVQELIAADKLWLEPYNQLTEMGGHELLEKADSLNDRTQRQLFNMSTRDYERLRPLMHRIINPDIPLWDSLEQHFSGHEELLESLKGLREVNSNPMYKQAHQLREEVKSGLGGAIALREELAQLVVDSGRSGATAIALQLIVESKELDRYRQNGHR